ncbi:patatin-like phospholipase family protein [Dyadobacter sp. 22481]|uniref:patatin-like phospholipase family protein n=1 Tax=Dyadobacter sp. 22481 TaxID=3453926 RepID=UPI003F85ABAA
MRLTEGLMKILSAIFFHLSRLVYQIWEIIKRFFLNKYVRCTLIMLWTVWPVLLVLMLAHLALTLMDQIRDLVDSLVQDRSYSVYAFIGVSLFSFTTWYCTKILFILKSQEALVEADEAGQNSFSTRGSRLKNEINIQLPKIGEYSIIDSDTLGNFTHYTPIALGLFPILSFFSTLSKIQGANYHIVALVVVLAIYLYVVHAMTKFTSNDEIISKRITGERFEDLLPIHKFSIRLGVIILFSFAILATNTTTNIFISSELGPISVIFVALSMWVSIAGFFNYLDYRYQTPFTVICLSLMLIFNNNNHQIRTLDTSGREQGAIEPYSGKKNQPAVPQHFSRWLDSLLVDRSIFKDTSSIIPVYLIATEGGGIRSAYWTASVLRKLDSTQANFFRHVYAISAVSGGSVGAVVFTAQYRDKLRNKRFLFDVNAFFKNDFLSPLITAMLIPDMLQKFSPVGFNSLDRARYLEDSWERAYSNLEQQKFSGANEDDQGSFKAFTTLGEPFMDLWRPLNGGKHIRLPILFLNSTHAESGLKGIITPVRIQEDPNFKNVIDIQEEAYRHIPLKTAASISARFPIVTPPATLQVVNEPWKDAANFVDGGYIDNSGTTTLLSVLSSITRDSTIVKTLKRHKVKIKVITINNSSELVSNNIADPLKGSYELSAPLQAFFKSWDNSGDARQYAVKEYLRGFSGSLLDNANRSKVNSIVHESPYVFNLDRKTGIIPLGWDLSLSAERRISDQANDVPRLLETKPYMDIFEGIRVLGKK